MSVLMPTGDPPLWWLRPMPTGCCCHASCCRCQMIGPGPWPPPRPFQMPTIETLPPDVQQAVDAFARSIGIQVDEPEDPPTIVRSES